MTAPGVSLTIDRLSVAYENRPALRDISWRFPAGSLTAIAGPNGAGKSTLLKAVIGGIRLAGGHVRLDPPAAAVAFLPQLNEIDRGFPITVADTVLFGRWRSLGWHREASAADLDATARALATVGLTHLAHRNIGALSAGQFQRVLFARLILQDAPVILLDEPFNALDQRTVQDLLSVVTGWHAEGRTVIAVLHDLDQIERHFPDTLLVARSLIAAGSTKSVLTPARLAIARETADRWDDPIEDSTHLEIVAS